MNFYTKSHKSLYKCFAKGITCRPWHDRRSEALDLRSRSVDLGQGRRQSPCPRSTEAPVKVPLCWVCARVKTRWEYVRPFQLPSEFHPFRVYSEGSVQVIALAKKKIQSIIRHKKRGANSMVEVRSAFKTLKVRNPVKRFLRTQQLKRHDRPKAEALDLRSLSFMLRI